MGKGDNLQGGVNTVPGNNTLGTSNPSQTSDGETLLQGVEVDAEKEKPEADCDDRYASESCGNGKGYGQSEDVLLKLESQDDLEKNVHFLNPWLWKHKFWIIIGVVAIFLTAGASVGIYYLAKPPETNDWTKSWTKPPEAEASGLQSGTTSPTESVDLPCGGDLVLTRGEDGEVNRTTLYADHKLRQPALVRECGIRLNNSLLTVDLPARCNGILTCLGQSKFCYQAKKGGYIKNIT